MTKYRKLILDIIKLSMGHMTAEEIYMQAKQKHPSIAIGTVYRNLGLMTEAGEIRRINVPGAPDIYDKTLYPHDHLICQNCGRVTDISIPDLKEFFKKKEGIEILGYDLNLRYICNECKNRKNR